MRRFSYWIVLSISLLVAFSDFWIGAYWQRHPMLAGFVGGMATLVITTLVIQRVLAYREQRQLEPLRNLVLIELRAGYTALQQFSQQEKMPYQCDAGVLGASSSSWLQFAKQAAEAGRELTDIVARWAKYTDSKIDPALSTRLINATKIADKLFEVAHLVNSADLEMMFGAADAEEYVPQHLSEATKVFKSVKNDVDSEHSELRSSYRYLL